MNKRFWATAMACITLVANGYGDANASSIELPYYFDYEFSVLYLQPWEKSAVVTNKYSPVISTDDFTQSKVLHPHFDWNWGFRIGTGYHFIPLQWRFGLEWTHFSSRASQTRRTNSDDSVEPNELKGSFPVWALQMGTLAGDYVSDSHLHWDLSLNLLDCNVERAFLLSRFVLTPFVGLRSGWIKQSFEITYTGGVFPQTLISPGLNVSGVMDVQMHNHYWGLGPRIGFSPSCLLGKGVSLYAEGAVSALLGFFHKKQAGQYLGMQEFDHQSSPFALRWVLDAQGGLMYKTPLFSKRYLLSLQLGYEFHKFYNQMRLPRDSFHVVPENSNLSLQGVVFNARFDF